ncbi:MAG: ABC transporter permease [Solirubrobacterales bacterium]
MSVATRARVVGALGRRSLRQAFRRPMFFAPVFVFPSLFLAVNTGGAGAAVDLPGFPAVHGFLDFQLAGAIVQSAMLSAVSAGTSLALDIETGFMDRLMAAPISRLSVVLGRLSANVVLGFMVGVWFLGLGLIFGAHIEGGVAAVALVILLSGLTAGAFGWIGAALALRAGRVSVVQGMFPLVFVILFLSSAYFPQALLEQPAKAVANVNPMSYIADGLREPVIANITGAVTLECLAGIAIVALVGMLWSASAMRRRLRAA